MAISSSEFQYLHQLVVSRSGVFLPEKDKYLAEARLVPLAREQRIGSVNELIEKAKSEGENGVSALILDALLPKETAFFRDPTLFELLKTQLLKTLEMKRSGECRLRIWCAGCASGQEAFSVAMLLHRYCSSLLNWDLDILATDLSPFALEKATQGQFDEIEVHRGVQPILVREYFRQDGGRYAIKSDVAELVRFEELNLIGDWPELPQMDIVFLRNVLRYMSAEAKRVILSRLKDLVKADGYLFLGAQESIVEKDSGFAMVPAGKTVYFQKSSGQNWF